MQDGIPWDIVQPRITIISQRYVDPDHQHEATHDQSGNQDSAERNNVLNAGTVRQTHLSIVRFPESEAECMTSSILNMILIQIRTTQLSGYRLKRI